MPLLSKRNSMCRMRFQRVGSRHAAQALRLVHRRALLSLSSIEVQQIR